MTTKIACFGIVFAFAPVARAALAQFSPPPSGRPVTAQDISGKEIQPSTWARGSSVRRRRIDHKQLGPAWQVVGAQAGRCQDCARGARDRGIARWPVPPALEGLLWARRRSLGQGVRLILVLSAHPNCNLRDAYSGRTATARRRQFPATARSSSGSAADSRRVDRPWRSEKCGT